jgi:hypothetical protein
VDLAVNTTGATLVAGVVSVFGSAPDGEERPADSTNVDESVKPNESADA